VAESTLLEPFDGNATSATRNAGRSHGVPVPPTPAG